MPNNEVSFQITATQNVDAAVAEAEAAFNGLAESTQGVQSQLDAVTSASEQAGTQLGSTGGSARETGDDFGSLANQAGTALEGIASLDREALEPIVSTFNAAKEAVSAFAEDGLGGLVIAGAAADTTLAMLGAAGGGLTTQMTRISDTLGITVEEADKLSIRFEDVGSSADLLVRIGLQLSQVMTQAAAAIEAGNTPSLKARTLMDDLGVSIFTTVNGTKELRSQGEVLQDTLVALSTRTDGSRLAAELFGRSVGQLIPVIQNWSNDTQNVTDQSAKLAGGLDNAADKSAAYHTALTSIGNDVKALELEALGPLTKALEAVGGGFDNLNEVTSGAAGAVVGSILLIVGAAGTLAMPLLGIKTALDLLTGVTGTHTVAAIADTTAIEAEGAAAAEAALEIAGLAAAEDTASVSAGITGIAMGGLAAAGTAAAEVFIATQVAAHDSNTEIRNGALVYSDSGKAAENAISAWKRAELQTGANRDAILGMSDAEVQARINDDALTSQLGFVGPAMDNASRATEGYGMALSNIVTKAWNAVDAIAAANTAAIKLIGYNGPGDQLEGPFLTPSGTGFLSAADSELLIENSTKIAKDAAKDAAKAAITSFGDEMSQQLANLEVEKEFGTAGGKVLEAFSAALSDPKKESAVADAIAKLIKDAEDAGVPNAAALGQDLIKAVVDGFSTGDSTKIYEIMHQLADSLSPVAVEAQKTADKIAQENAKLAKDYADTQVSIAAANAKHVQNLNDLAHAHEEALTKISNSTSKHKEEDARLEDQAYADKVAKENQRNKDDLDRLNAAYAKEEAATKDAIAKLGGTITTYMYNTGAEGAAALAAGLSGEPPPGAGRNSPFLQPNGWGQGGATAQDQAQYRASVGGSQMGYTGSIYDPSTSASAAILALVAIWRNSQRQGAQVNVAVTGPITVNNSGDASSVGGQIGQGVVDQLRGSGLA